MAEKEYKEEMKNMISKPSFESKDEFIAYLRETLIPDLIESGKDGTSQDFCEAIYWITK